MPRNFEVFGFDLFKNKVGILGTPISNMNGDGDHLAGKYTWYERQGDEVLGIVEYPDGQLETEPDDEAFKSFMTSTPAIQLCIVTLKKSDSPAITRELSYIGQDCFRLPSVLARSYGHQTRRLDLSFNNLKTLDGLENFTVLEELVLDNNSLTDEVTFPYNANLHTLSLNKNNLDDLDRLLNQLAKSYPNLSYLSILGNPACPDQLSCLEKDEDDYQRYRYHVLYILPKLNFLDFKLVKNSERSEAQRIGAFVKVVRPEPRDANDEVDEDVIDVARFNPLPDSTTLEGSHKGAFGVLKYKYSGKHSEGNRFIRNNEL